MKKVSYGVLESIRSNLQNDCQDLAEFLWRIPPLTEYSAKINQLVSKCLSSRSVRGFVRSLGLELCELHLAPIIYFRGASSIVTFAQRANESCISKYLLCPVTFTRLFWSSIPFRQPLISFPVQALIENHPYKLIDKKLHWSHSYKKSFVVSFFAKRVLKKYVTNKRFRFGTERYIPKSRSLHLLHLYRTFHKAIAPTRIVGELGTPWFLFTAVFNLLELLQCHRLRIQAVVFCPIIRGDARVGFAVFALKKIPNAHEILALHSIASEIAFTLNNIESMVALQRGASYELARGRLLAHKGRGLLFTQANYLLSASQANQTEQRRPEDLIEQFKVYQERIVQWMDQLEKGFYGYQQEATLINSQTLATAIFRVIPSAYRSCISIAMNPDNPLQIRIPGALDDLISLLMVFIDNAITASTDAKQNHNLEYHLRNANLRWPRVLLGRAYQKVSGEIGPGPYLAFIGIIAESITPRIGALDVLVYDCGTGFDSEVLSALQNTSLFGSLPSTKLGGGRGLLSAINILRQRYRGDAVLVNTMSPSQRDWPSGVWSVVSFDKGGTGWSLRIPGFVAEVDSFKDDKPPK